MSLDLSTLSENRGPVAEEMLSIWVRVFRSLMDVGQVSRVNQVDVRLNLIVVGQPGALK